MPDSIRSCGEPKTPAHRITSLAARIVSRPVAVMTSTPVARLPSMTTRAMCTRVRIVRPGRPWPSRYPIEEL